MSMETGDKNGTRMVKKAGEEMAKEAGNVASAATRLGLPQGPLVYRDRPRSRVGTTTSAAVADTTASSSSAPSSTPVGTTTSAAAPDTTASSSAAPASIPVGTTTSAAAADTTASSSSSTPVGTTTSAAAADTSASSSPAPSPAPSSAPSSTPVGATTSAAAADTTASSSSAPVGTTTSAAVVDTTASSSSAPVGTTTSAAAADTTASSSSAPVLNAIPDEDTLNESIGKTIWRDVVTIGRNLRSVLIPINWNFTGREQALRNWDLWGPLIFMLMLASVLSWGESKSSEVFSMVFAQCALGAIVLTGNVILLGGDIIFFQSLCLLGYCLFPMCVAAIFCLIFKTVWVRIIALLGGLTWAAFATIPFIGSAVPEGRKALAIYPVMLLYVSIGWLGLVKK
eukprot:gene2905-4963_t